MKQFERHFSSVHPIHSSSPLQTRQQSTPSTQLNSEKKTQSQSQLHFQFLIARKKTLFHLLGRGFMNKVRFRPVTKISDYLSILTQISFCRAARVIGTHF